jgi:hypothetical protein
MTLVDIYDETGKIGIATGIVLSMFEGFCIEANFRTDAERVFIKFKNHIKLDAVLAERYGANWVASYFWDKDGGGAHLDLELPVFFEWGGSDDK